LLSISGLCKGCADVSQSKQFRKQVEKEAHDAQLLRAQLDETEEKLRNVEEERDRLKTVMKADRDAAVKYQQEIRHIMLTSEATKLDFEEQIARLTVENRSLRQRLGNRQEGIGRLLQGEINDISLTIHEVPSSPESTRNHFSSTNTNRSSPAQPTHLAADIGSTFGDCSEVSMIDCDDEVLQSDPNVPHSSLVSDDGCQSNSRQLDNEIPQRPLQMTCEEASTALPATSYDSTTSTSAYLRSLNDDLAITSPIKDNESQPEPRQSDHESFQKSTQTAHEDASMTSMSPLRTLGDDVMLICDLGAGASLRKAEETLDTTGLLRANNHNLQSGSDPITIVADSLAESASASREAGNLSLPGIITFLTLPRVNHETAKSNSNSEILSDIPINPLPSASLSSPNREKGHRDSTPKLHASPLEEDPVDITGVNHPTSHTDSPTWEKSEAQSLCSATDGTDVQPGLASSFGKELPGAHSQPTGGDRSKEPSPKPSMSSSQLVSDELGDTPSNGNQCDTTRIVDSSKASIALQALIPSSGFSALEPVAGASVKLCETYSTADGGVARAFDEPSERHSPPTAREASNKSQELLINGGSNSLQAACKDASTASTPPIPTLGDDAALEDTGPLPDLNGSIFVNNEDHSSTFSSPKDGRHPVQATSDKHSDIGFDAPNNLIEDVGSLNPGGDQGELSETPSALNISTAIDNESMSDDEGEMATHGLPSRPTSDAPSLILFDPSGPSAGKNFQDNSLTASKSFDKLSNTHCFPSSPARNHESPPSERQSLGTRPGLASATFVVTAGPAITPDAGGERKGVAPTPTTATPGESVETVGQTVAPMVTTSAAENMTPQKALTSTPNDAAKNWSDMSSVASSMPTSSPNQPLSTPPTSEASNTPGREKQAGESFPGGLATESREGNGEFDLVEESHAPANFQELPTDPIDARETRDILIVPQPQNTGHGDGRGEISSNHPVGSLAKWGHESGDRNVPVADVVLPSEGVTPRNSTPGSNTTEELRGRLIDPELHSSSPRPADNAESIRSERNDSSEDLSEDLDRIADDQRPGLNGSVDVDPPEIQAYFEPSQGPLDVSVGPLEAVKRWIQCLNLDVGQIKEVVAVGNGLLRHDLRNFWSLNLLRWQGDTLWSSSTYLPPVNGRSSENPLIQAFECVIRVTRIGQVDGLRLRMVLVSLVKQIDDFEVEQRKNQNSETGKKGVGLRTKAIENALEHEFGPSWNELSDSDRKWWKLKLRALTKHGRRWRMLTESLGLGVLILASEETEIKMYAPSFRNLRRSNVCQ
jgi:hypothetical protein